MPLTKLVSSGIGLAFEINEARKEHKANKVAKPRDSSQTPVPSQNQRAIVGAAEASDDNVGNLMEYGESQDAPSRRQPFIDQDADEKPPAYTEAREMDEADWQLDEAIPDPIGSPSSDDLALGEIPRGDEARKHYVDKIVQKFLSRHPPPFEAQVKGNLPCPVIIPQRRPHKKSRGFVQAYAPVLANCQIDQDAFMEFHKALFKASQASPTWEVINLAAAIAGFAPSVAAMVTSIVVQAATRIAIEVQSRQRTNSFLGQMNDQFFRPRGLYCMVMKYDPNEKPSREHVDMSTTIMKSLSIPESKAKERMRNFQTASAKSYGEIEMPEAAPLTYPGLNIVNDIDENGKRKGNFKRTGEFLTNYYDKRAQARYAAEHQGSTLASALPPDRKFASRFGDPNHPVNSGSLISLITGGAIDPKRNENDRHGRSRIGRGHSGGGLIGGVRQEFGLGGRSRENQDRAREPSYGNRSDPKGFVKRMLQPNMLYLMIVNIPTEEEMAEARDILAASQR